MKLSIHTVARDAIRLDYHLVQMLQHHLPFADEIVVMEGHSTDGTYEAIRNLGDTVRVVRTPWRPTDSYLDMVEKGRKEVTGDWAIKLDADEFIPEWEWDRLRAFLRDTDDKLVPIRLRNFYGNYRVEHTCPQKLRWPEYKWCIHRNQPEYEFWGDASNAKIHNHAAEFGRSDTPFEVHHFGAVRHAARLREKWRTQAIRNQRHSGKYFQKSPIRMIPAWLFNLFPHNWNDKDIVADLAIYDGPLMQIVRSCPEEFVRDGMQTYRYVQGMAGSPDR